MDEKNKRGAKFLGFLLLAVCVIWLAVQPLAAQTVTIPEGSTINSAIMHVWVQAPNNHVVSIHRITANWAETDVTYANFGNAYAAASEGQFTADAQGWKSVDITSLVQAWAVGTYPNYGVVMIEPIEASDGVYAVYWSSDYDVDPTLRPKLVLGYTPPGGSLQYVTIQRPGGEALQVVDSWISALDPTLNFGVDPVLVTNFYNNKQKSSLIRFLYTYVPLESPGTGTPGYWMNHPEAWPVPGITIGGTYYLMNDAIALMMMPDGGDKTYTMFDQLVAAKLNVLIGNASGCIAATIDDADDWMEMYPVGSGVKAGGPASPWRVGEPLKNMLDQYNNGLLCAPSRD